METFAYSLVRLFPEDSDRIVSHISELSVDDRYLRFGYSISDVQLCHYVQKSLSTINAKNKSDFWFGIVDDSDIIVASLHVAIYDDVAEFAFTTSVEHRGKKLGQLMFARGYQLATEFRVDKIYMVCLTKNMAVRHIAKKFGLSVMTMGTESEASVNIQYPVPLSKVHTVKMSIIDKNIFKEG